MTDAVERRVPVHRRTVSVVSVNDVPSVSTPPQSFLTPKIRTTSVFTSATVSDLDIHQPHRQTAVVTVTTTMVKAPINYESCQPRVYSVVGNELRANGTRIATFCLSAEPLLWC